ncbi:MAG TPA: DUF934 domain-containing protein [Alphaproteobacteria bacterium]|nr:DUF934 domain-containing protein [Alphaproteobacteria bacterium]
MPLIKGGEVVEDPWRLLADDEAAPAEGPIAVTLERWQQEQNALLSRAAPLGLRLKAGQHPQAVAEEVARFALIALEFPKFTDGRAYSYARLLRERYGYKGELRAVGQVLRDQLLFMHRCGFDAFEIARADAAEAWRKALGEIGVFYQPMGVGAAAVSERRRELAIGGGNLRGNLGRRRA